MIALATSPGLVARVVSLRFLRWLGTISYGIYVFHILLNPLIRFATRRLVGEGSLMRFNLVQFLLAAAFSLIAATLSFSLYEKPFLRLKRFFVPAHRASAGSPGAEA
jgi:peptidoglycan/LPS O-acetylase OafA/YrhL